jgi:hypothetical protein
VRARREREDCTRNIEWNAFLIHFVSDVHQPLHAAWESALVYKLEDIIDSGNPNAAAQARYDVP